MVSRARWFREQAQAPNPRHLLMLAPIGAHSFRNARKSSYTARDGPAPPSERSFLSRAVLIVVTEQDQGLDVFRCAKTCPDCWHLRAAHTGTLRRLYSEHAGRCRYTGGRVVEGRGKNPGRGGLRWELGEKPVSGVIALSLKSLISLGKPG
jgi:hypothetical protein